MAQNSQGNGQRRPEPHFMQSDIVRDVVIGMSDGLTVPFAIAAGMTGASAGSHLVIIAALSEIAAGSISMGVGGYLSGRTDIEHYRSERKREKRETEEVPQQEKREVAEIMRNWGLEDEQVDEAVDALSQDQDKWVDFMMRFELGLEKPERQRAVQSALTIGLSYGVAGLIPLAPYVFISNVQTALYVSAGLTLLALIVFGYTRARLIAVSAIGSAVRTVIVGALAAGAAYAIARLIG